MVVLYDRDIWLLVLVFELVFAFLRFLILIFVFFVVLLSLTLFLLLLQLGLLLEFVYSLSLSDFVVADDPLSHVVVIGVDELAENPLFLLILFLKLLVKQLDLAYLCGELQEGGLVIAFVCPKGPQLVHELHVVGLHVSENDELLGIGKNLHLHQVKVTLQLVLNIFEGQELAIELLYLFE